MRTFEQWLQENSFVRKSSIRKGYPHIGTAMVDQDDEDEAAFNKQAGDCCCGNDKKYGAMRCDKCQNKLKK